MFRSLPGLKVTGVDMHIGSQITDLAPFDDAFSLLADFVRELRADGHRIDHVDLGGGLGDEFHAEAPGAGREQRPEELSAGLGAVVVDGVAAAGVGLERQFGTDAVALP